MKRSMRGLVTLCLLPTAAWGQELPLAQCETDAVCLALYDQAQHQSRAGALADAAKTYELAYALSHDARLLFNIARVLDKRGQAEDAKSYYRQFLQSSQDESQKAKANERLALLDANKEPSTPPKIAPTALAAKTATTVLSLVSELKVTLRSGPVVQGAPQEIFPEKHLILRLPSGRIQAIAWDELAWNSQDSLGGGLSVRLRTGPTVLGIPKAFVWGNHILLQRPNGTRQRIEWAEIDMNYDFVPFSEKQSLMHVDGLRVTIVSSDSRARLFHSEGTERSQICQMPCDKIVTRRGSYIIGGLGIMPSRSFTLTGRRINLFVKAGTNAKRIGGWSAMGVGVVGMLSLLYPLILYSVQGEKKEGFALSVSGMAVSASLVIFGKVLHSQSETQVLSNGGNGTLIFEPEPEPSPSYEPVAPPSYEPVAPRTPPDLPEPSWLRSDPPY